MLCTFAAQRNAGVASAPHAEHDDRTHPPEDFNFRRYPDFCGCSPLVRAGLWVGDFICHCARDIFGDSLGGVNGCCCDTTGSPWEAASPAGSSSADAMLVECALHLKARH